MIYDYIVESIIRENEPSLRLLSEWIIIRLISQDQATRLNDLYEYLRDAPQHKTGTVCAWISIASHIANSLANKMEQVCLKHFPIENLYHFFYLLHDQIEYINKIFGYISPMLIH